ncbi:MAG: hypothetical protein Q8M94_01550 [Ignavibacteria bacterium]|nr:hypothetical protein [Ignavibacteria bacterium]
MCIDCKRCKYYDPVLSFLGSNSGVLCWLRKNPEKAAINGCDHYVERPVVISDKQDELPLYEKETL